jgi:drug/metabolite transporter (DMT)-like permease
MDAASPITLLGWRFLAGFLFMTLCIPLRILKINYKNKPVGKLMLLALMQPILYFVGETCGIRMTTTGETATFIAMIPIVTMLMAAAVLKEPPTPAQAAGIVISLAGIITIVISKGMTASFSVIGYLFLLMAVASDAGYVLLSRKLTMFSVPEKVYVMTAAGALAFGPAAVFENAAAGTLQNFMTLPLRDPGFLAAVLYLSLGCTVLAFILCIHSITYLGPTRSSSFAPLTTVISIAAGVALLNEKFSVFQAAGSVLTLLGVFLANRTEKQLGSEKSA